MAQRKSSIERGVPYKPRSLSPDRKYYTGPRPERWITGPDRLTHEQYESWLVHKAQARFRGEEHDLSFEDFKELWDQDGNWHSRGRNSTDICMTRWDSGQAWCKENIRMIERSQLIKEHNEKKVWRGGRPPGKKNANKL